jgi:hypothetical protein
MREVMKDVTTKGKVVATIGVSVADSIEEAIESWGKDFCLRAANRIKQDDLMNTKRAEFQPNKAGKQKKMELAYSLCTPDELLATKNDFVALQKLLESKFPIVEANLIETA